MAAKGQRSSSAQGQEGSQFWLRQREPLYVVSCIGGSGDGLVLPAHCSRWPGLSPFEPGVVWLTSYEREDFCEFVVGSISDVDKLARKSRTSLLSVTRWLKQDFGEAWRMGHFLVVPTNDLYSTGNWLVVSSNIICRLLSRYQRRSCRALMNLAAAGDRRAQGKIWKLFQDAGADHPDFPWFDETVDWLAS